jgi:hypothetical protein
MAPVSYSVADSGFSTGPPPGVITKARTVVFVRAGRSVRHKDEDGAQRAQRWLDVTTRRQTQHTTPRHRGPGRSQSHDRAPGRCPGLAGDSIVRSSTEPDDTTSGL